MDCSIEVYIVELNNSLFFSNDFHIAITVKEFYELWILLLKHSEGTLDWPFLWMCKFNLYSDTINHKVYDLYYMKPYECNILYTVGLWINCDME